MMLLPLMSRPPACDRMLATTVVAAAWLLLLWLRLLLLRLSG